MILSLPDNKPETHCICEYCKSLIKVPVDIIGTGITINDFTILKKTVSPSDKTDIFIAHQISLDRPVFFELCKKILFPVTLLFLKRLNFLPI